MPKTKYFRNLSQRQKYRRLKQVQNQEFSTLASTAGNQIEPQKSCISDVDVNIDQVPAFPVVAENSNSSFNYVEKCELVNMSCEDICMDNSKIEQNASKKESLKTKLIQWADEYKIQQNSFSSILKILKNEGHEDLPSDARTLMKTSRFTTVHQKSRGQYFHCSKCVCEGTYDNHRMLFLDENCILRTDESFATRKNPEHHTGTLHDTLSCVGGSNNNNPAGMNLNLNNPVLEKFLFNMNRKLDYLISLHEGEKRLPMENISTDKLPEFPIGSLGEFKKFCHGLTADKELGQLFKNKIIKIGGETGKKHLTNVLVFTLTNKLGKELTWDGQRQTTGIKDSSFANLVLATVLNRHVEATYNNLDRTFSEWLRRSGDRYRYHYKLGRET